MNPLRIVGIASLLLMSSAMFCDAQLLAQSKPFDAIEDQPGLPRVLLIGDSISIGYQVAVRQQLQGVANVHRPKRNCGPTTRGLAQLDNWLGDKPWDVIHFNWGLHDLKYINAKGGLAPPAEGTIQVPLVEYEKNLRKLVARLQKTGARLVWCATTPVPEGARGRIAGSEKSYNAAAQKVMREARIPIDDLYEFAASRVSEIQRPRDVHFTPAGSKVLAQQVARSIRTVLRRPNYLVILCDDLGYGDLSSYGSTKIKTPHLDALAKSGVRWTSCYASAPVCSPSRAGLLTGRTPSRSGIFDWIPGGHPMHLRRSEVTLAGLLRDAGYRTGHFGKWHLNGKFNKPDQAQPNDHGFDEWFSTQNNASPTHENPNNFVRNGKRVGAQEGFSCQIVADRTMDWVEKLDRSKPFFAFTCFHEPHEPIASPKDLVDTHPEAKKRGEALYYANVENMDRAVGSMLERLDKMGLNESTVVFFTSDNGPETLNRYGRAWRSHGSPGPLRGMKLHIYEGGIRVPGILRWPGKTRAGQTLDVPVSSVDLLPSFCSSSLAAVPQNLDGASFLSALEGGSIERSRPLFWHYFQAFGDPKVAIREGSWKLLGHLDVQGKRPGGSVHPGDQQIIKSAKITAVELYDLDNDLAESKDRSGEEVERTAKMKARLEKMFREVLADAPTWDIKARK